jgi:hypothetical protein
MKLDDLLIVYELLVLIALVLLMLGEMVNARVPLI